MSEMTKQSTKIDRDHWAQRLNDLAKKHRVVGAELGIRTLSGTEALDTFTTSSGLLNERTGVATTPDSLFEIGSISKVWTTALVLQLVDEGKIALNDTLQQVLPELKLADPDATSRITVRQLLNHSSGIDGDLFFFTGRGDDAVENYVAELKTAALIHPTGAGFSYCNSGFVIAGRIVEVFRGKNWDEALHDHLIEPLGLSHTVTLPEHALLHSTAVGHTVEDDGTITLPARWGIARGMGPAGSIASTVHDQIVFATALLNNGVAENGTRVLSAASASMMRDVQNKLTPERSYRFRGWGLGWFLEKWGNEPVFGHDGGTIAQRAFLRVLPETGLIVSLLTNSADRGSSLYNELIREIADTWHATMQPAFAPKADYRPDATELDEFTGTYETGALKLTVARDGDTLRLDLEEKLSLVPDAELGESEHFELQPVARGQFALRDKDWLWESVLFYEAPGGHYVAYGHRTLPKVA